MMTSGILYAHSFHILVRRARMHLRGPRWGCVVVSVVLVLSLVASAAYSNGPTAEHCVVFRRDGCLHGIHVGKHYNALAQRAASFIREDLRVHGAQRSAKQQHKVVPVYRKRQVAHLNLGGAPVALPPWVVVVVVVVLAAPPVRGVVGIEIIANVAAAAVLLMLIPAVITVMATDPAPSERRHALETNPSRCRCVM